MNVREVMTTENLLTIGENDTLAVAAHRMTWGKCRHLPVVRDREVVAARMISQRIGGLPVVIHGRLVGMITSSDLLGQIVAQMYTPTLDRG